MYDTKGFNVVKVIITGVLFLLTLCVGTLAKCATFYIIVHLSPTVSNSTDCDEHYGTEESPTTHLNPQNNLTAWIWYEQDRNIKL